MTYTLSLFTQSDMLEVLNVVVPQHMIKKYLNSSTIYRLTSFLGLLHSDLYVLKNEDKHIVAAGVIRKKGVLRKTYWLYGIEVKSDLRGKGVGGELIQALFTIAEKKNIKTLYLKVNIDNFQAINLYKKFDFRKKQIKGNIIIMMRTIYKN